MTVSSSQADAVLNVASQSPGLELLVLHGSRAREEARPDSDWDFAYLADETFDPDEFLGRLVLALGTERVDLARLDPAGGLFRFRVARDARVLFEARPGVFDRFWLQAVRFWCDAEPVLRQAYGELLADYRRQPLAKGIR